MERKIGEIFECGGEWYQCVEQPKEIDDTVCKLCAMSKIKNCDIGKCSGQYRTDGKSVIFKKLEKLGEPYEYYIQGIGIIMVQEYSLADSNYIWDYNQNIVVMDCQNRRVAIEIKQNKEDMEENKLNLKPFDLEAAIQGKPVCTRDGRKARIVCFDAKGCYPIIALTAELDNTEDITKCTEEGISSYHKNDDLMMLPEKHEGWVNVYKERCYETKEEAIKNKYDGATCVDTVKIEYYE